MGSSPQGCPPGADRGLGSSRHVAAWEKGGSGNCAASSRPGLAVGSCRQPGRGLTIPVSLQRRPWVVSQRSPAEEAARWALLPAVSSCLWQPVRRGVFVRMEGLSLCPFLGCLSKGLLSWSQCPGLAARDQVQNRLFSLAPLSPGLASLVPFHLALNLIGPRAVDVLSELSYAPMTPDHFPSLFCKVGANKVLVVKWVVKGILVL